MKDDQAGVQYFSESPSMASTLKANKDRSAAAPSVSAPVSACQSPFSSDPPTAFPAENGGGALPARKNSTCSKRTSFAYRIREHVRMGLKFSETVKGKLSVGAKIIKKGGRENMFRDIFGASNGEKLIKASQCYLSTTAGPIAGILFISTEKVAFCSERSIAVHSSTHGIIRTPYKVCIPVKKIKAASGSENVNKPAQKFIDIVTHDNYEFWFMGFVRYEKALMSLEMAISTPS